MTSVWMRGWRLNQDAYTYNDLWNFLGKTVSIATQQLDKGSAEQ